MTTSQAVLPLLIVLAFSPVAALSIERPPKHCVPVGLTCEFREEPLGVEAPRPRLSWRLSDPRRGARQTAYRVVVAATPGKLAKSKDVEWDTGKVDSDRCTLVAYAGKALESRRRYWWKVRVWDAEGVASPWSEPSSWEMGLLSPADWAADWIGYRWPEERGEESAPGHPGDWIYPYNMIDRFEYWNRLPARHCFRRTFELDSPGRVESTRFWIRTDKPVRAWLNGRLVLDRFEKTRELRRRTVADELHHLDPPAREADVRSAVREGQNVLAVELYKPSQTPLATMQCALEIRRNDGSMRRVPSDRKWLAAAGEDPEREAWGGPVPYVDIPSNWNTSGFENPEPGSKMRWHAADGSGAAHPLRNRRSICLRRAFDLAEAPARARVYVTALGLHQVRINGRPVSPDVLAPGKGSYDQFWIGKQNADFFGADRLKQRVVPYQVYDVTGLLRPGANAVGAVLGNGWYNSVGLNLSYRKPLLRLQLEIAYPDGSTERLVTDDRWRAYPSGTLFDSVHFGEIHDARKEPDGWSRPEFDASSWDRASEIKPVYDYHYAKNEPPELVAEGLAPIRVTAELKPSKIERLDDETHLFHFDRLASGFCRLKLDGAEPGRRVTLRYGSTEDRIAPRFGNRQEDVNVCRGGKEEWRKRFGYGLLRYVRVEGLPEEPTEETLTFLVCHNDLPRAGSFSCSNDVVNSIWRAVRWTMRGNIHSVPVDCDREKINWPWAAGSFHIGAMAYPYRMDRLPTSMFGIGGAPGAYPWVAGWGDGMVFHPYRSYVFYGDRRFARRYYEEMKLLVDRRIDSSRDGLWRSDTFGDWQGLNKQESGGMFGAAHHYVTTQHLARLAAALGRQEDARRYRELLPSIGRAFSRGLFDRERMTYTGDNQRALAIPLSLGFVPEDAQQPVEERFLRMVAECDEFLRKEWREEPDKYEKLRGRCLRTGGASLDYHPTVAIYGQPFLLWALTRTGHHEAAYRMITRTSYPSWGHMAIRGTAIAEGFGPNNSHLGRINVGAWIFEALGGVRPDPAHPGFKRFIVRPRPAGDLEWAEVDYESPLGPIESRWRRGEGGAFDLDLTVPPNSSALVFLPGAGQAEPTVTESGVPVGRAEGVRRLQDDQPFTYWWAEPVRPHETGETDRDSLCFEVQSGCYRFRVEP